MRNPKRIVSLAIGVVLALSAGACSGSSGVAGVAAAGSTEPAEPTAAATATVERSPSGADRSAETCDFGASATGWALCVSTLDPAIPVKMFVYYGTPDVAAWAVDSWAFGSEVGDSDLLGSTVVLETVPLPPIEPGATVEVEATVSLLELATDQGGVIEDRSGTGTALVQIENLADQPTW